MKKLLCILLMLLFTLPTLAEETVWNGYVLHIPEGVDTESNEGSATFVADTARVVAIIISRVADENPAEAIKRLMGQFDPDAVIDAEIPMAEGFTALQALTEGKFGEGLDVLTIMVLADEGELLILSGYDMAGDEEKAQALLDNVLSHVKVRGESIITEE